MSNETAILINKLTKVYKLYSSPADRVRETFSPFRTTYHQPFFALRDVSLEIARGETVGIIGRNGCGKSTLLQLICGILQPTAGTVAVNGRISALLELGAGFNAEFTGRQNIYLNGSILGLSVKEVDEHLDSILAFADIGDYVDQPVKCYSSGMYVRLAFAVAISIKPDILVVDEALAVGDEAFQRKCFTHINKIQESGGTILFVSHSAASIIELCNRAMLFDHGELLLAGQPKPVVQRYHKLLYSSPDYIEAMKERWRQRVDRYQLLDQQLPEPPAEEVTARAPESDAEEPAGPEALEPTVPTCTAPPPEVADFGFLAAGDDDSPPSGREYDPQLVPASTIEYERKGALISDVFLADAQGNKVNLLTCGEKYFYCYSVLFEASTSHVQFGMLIKTMTGIALSGSSGKARSLEDRQIMAGSNYRVRFPFVCRFNPGVYFLNAGVLGRLESGEEAYLDRRLDVAMFKVIERQHLYSTSIVDLIDYPEIEQVDNDFATPS